MTTPRRHRFVYLLGAIAIAVALLIGITSLLSATSLISASAQEPPSDRTITVSGEGRVAAAADVATLDVGVEITGDEIAEVFDDANQQMNDVRDALEELGIPDDQIETSIYSIRVERDRQPESAQISGYTVRNSFQVTVDDVDRVPEVIAGVVDAGANQVGNIRFAVEDREALIAEARELAVEDAEERASQLAELVGVNLGQVVTITESSAPGPIPVAVEETAADAAAPPIEPGEQEVAVSLSVTYAIE